MLTKEAGTRQRTQWHQDQPYYNIEGRMNCSFWIPVDPVTRPSTLEFVAGSHLGPWLVPRSFLNDQAKWFPDRCQSLRIRCRRYLIVTIDSDTGELPPESTSPVSANTSGVQMFHASKKTVRFLPISRRSLNSFEMAFLMIER